MLPNDPTLAHLLQRLIVDPGVAPGGAAAIAKLGPGGDWRLVAAAAGTLEYELGPGEGAPRPACTETLYDLASLTKPVTALVCARLAASGTLSLSNPLGDLLPEVRGTLSASAPLDLLLSHRGGLLPHLDFFAPLRQMQPFDLALALRTAASARRPECAGTIPPQGFAPLYSDLGYLLLGEALSRITAQPLDELMLTHVSTPLGIELCSVRQWESRTDFSARVAPTEFVPWRGGLLRGRVHDENAWAFANTGCAGNAGLFAHAADVARLGMAVLDVLGNRRADWIPPTHLSLLIAARAGGTLRAGFDGKSSAGSSAGQLFGPATFGHLGFTGTSLWCDPDAQVVAAVLSNRVHPTRSNTLHQRYRPLLADALFSLTQGTLGEP